MFNSSKLHRSHGLLINQVGFSKNNNKLPGLDQCAPDLERLDAPVMFRMIATIEAAIKVQGLGKLPIAPELLFRIGNTASLVAYNGFVTRHARFYIGNASKV